VLLALRAWPAPIKGAAGGGWGGGGATTPGGANPPTLQLRGKLPRKGGSSSSSSGSSSGGAVGQPTLDTPGTPGEHWSISPLSTPLTSLSSVTSEAGGLVGGGAALGAVPAVGGRVEIQ
jgi:hypothetical protein